MWEGEGRVGEIFAGNKEAQTSDNKINQSWG